MKHLQPFRVGDVFYEVTYFFKPADILYDSVKTKGLGFSRKNMIITSHCTDRSTCRHYKEKSNKMLPSVSDKIWNLL